MPLGYRVFGLFCGVESGGSGLLFLARFRRWNWPGSRGGWPWNWPGFGAGIGPVPVGFGPGAGVVLVPDWRGCRVVRHGEMESVLAVPFGGMERSLFWGAHRLQYPVRPPHLRLREQAVQHVYGVYGVGLQRV